jgi:NADP-dependent 3-hydroxy acid dehydrogenase YdfG
MDLDLKDKVAFVSGSTAGIGFAIATALPAKACAWSSTAARSRPSTQRSRRFGHGRGRTLMGSPAI